MNNTLLVDERQSDLGNFIVGRLLPFRKKRQVGPFTFIDHMGPTEINPGDAMDVDQHPHIGLSTLTYLFQGEVHHRDSIGSDQIVKPGDVAFMTAGKGVTHSERTPQYLRNKAFNMHGYQIWVALPKDREEMEPQFDYYPSDEIPAWEEKGVKFRLAAGNAFGKSAPLQGFSPLFMVDIETEIEQTISLDNQLEGEVAFVIVKGNVHVANERVKAGQMLISKSDQACEICMDSNTQVLLFGGTPLEEERFLLWNFVSSSKERLLKAKEDWIEKRFPKIDGDLTYIPFPEHLF
ncbi:MAG: pirin family protein [Bacteroidota bacterium]